jgi:hypothetical protein
MCKIFYVALKELLDGQEPGIGCDAGVCPVTDDDRNCEVTPVVSEVQQLPLVAPRFPKWSYSLSLEEGCLVVWAPDNEEALCSRFSMFAHLCVAGQFGEEGVQIFLSMFGQPTEEHYQAFRSYALASLGELTPSGGWEIEISISAILEKAKKLGVPVWDGVHSDQGGLCLAPSVYQLETGEPVYHAGFRFVGAECEALRGIFQV